MRHIIFNCKFVASINDKSAPYLGKAHKKCFYCYTLHGHSVNAHNKCIRLMKEKSWHFINGKPCAK